MNRSLSSIGQDFIRAKALVPASKAKFSKDSLEALENKTARFHDAELYKTDLVKAGDVSEIFGKSTEDAEVGFSNVDKRKVPYDMSLEKIKLEFAVVADSETDPKAVEYTNLFDTGELPPAILNGQLEIIVGSETIVKDMPVSRFIAVASTAMVDAKGSRSVELNNIKMLYRDQMITANLRPAVGVAFPAGKKIFTKLSLIGTAVLR